ncbi:MAG: YhbY family RNA-binding protein [Lentimonas sp.]
MDEPTPLSSAEKKELRGIAQRLKPHLHIGKQGLTETVTNEIEMALSKNGLIKIRFEAEKTAIKTLQTAISEKTQSEYIGGIGKVGIFFREMPAEASDD